mgnify:CR=1 FL=1
MFQLLGYAFAQFNAPLVERIDVPDDALREHTMLIEGDQPAECRRGETVGQNRVRRPVSLEHLVRHEPLRHTLATHLVCRLAERERLAASRIDAYLARLVNGEEQFVGEAVSEDDKPIKHTKEQDAKWFTLTVVAGPLMVLVFGLVGTWARRRRMKPTEVKS